MDGRTIEVARRGLGAMRWRARFALVGVATLMLGACAWPTFRADVNHSGATLERVIAPEDRGALTTRFTGMTGGPVFSSPAVVDGVVYVGSDDGRLYAFDANGSTNCGQTPTQCAPLWMTPGGFAMMSSPAVANGVVYVGGDSGMLQAFDAHGAIGCSGTPKVCQPLWTSPQLTTIRSSPVVADGVVYIGTVHETIEAFDAAGNTGCSGTPKVCQPLWQGPAPGLIGAQESSPAVANGMVYVGSRDGKVYAFDAAGNIGCGGSPKVCQPVWSAVTTAGANVESSPSIVDGVLYIGSDDEKLYAFDAAGTINCTTGASRSCAPLWTAPIHLGTSASPAVTKGIVWVTSDDGVLETFDAGGNLNCSGVPKTCAPLWTGVMGGAHFLSSPAVANGTVYVGSGSKVFGFDQDAVVNCSGSPLVCNPIWTATTGGFVQSSPAVSNEIVYIGSGDGNLYAFGLPANRS